MDDSSLFTTNEAAKALRLRNAYGSDLWSVHWPYLRGLRITVSLDILSHFEVSGLNYYHIKIAEAISSRPAITSAAQTGMRAHYETCLNSTNPLHQALLVMTKYNTGAAFLGLFACLHSYYSLTSTIDCFVELALAVRLPHDLFMSRQAWQDLITTLDSIMPPAPPDFANLLEAYNAFRPHNTDGVTPHANPPRPLTHTSAIGVVDHLYACSHLVRLQGPNDPVLSMLGLDAGWGAATAKWLFGLNIELRDTFDGPNLINGRDDDQCQIVSYFGQPGIPVDTGVPIPSVPLELK